MTRVSVIIPTHNRRDSIVKAVSRLVAQDYPGDQFEIIVVTDRCDDGTTLAIAEEFGSLVTVLESGAPGQPAALNTGIAAADGDIVVFLDDEMLAFPDFISQHVAAHGAEPNARIAVTGYSPVFLDDRSPRIHRYLAERYELFHRDLSAGALTRSPAAFNGANSSIALQHVRAVGGFNAGYFFQRNDFELAARLLERGFEFRYNPLARADQHLAVTTEAMISRAEPRGENDVRLAREFPWCVGSLPFKKQLDDPVAAAKWRAIWIGRGLIPRTLGALRRSRPDSIALIRLEYAARYAIAVIRSLGGWRGWTELARTAAQ